MSKQQERLSVRIPWLIEAVAEGRFAILVLLAVITALLLWKFW